VLQSAVLVEITYDKQLNFNGHPAKVRIRLST